MRLVFASNNAHKLDEVRRIMPSDIEVLSLSDIGFEAEIEETGTTLEENSAIKAEAVYQWILDHGHCSLDGVFADDTGLEIDALGGKPGVYTARWAGEPAANRKKALNELQGKTDRGAQFRTVITLIKVNGERLAVSGIVRGQIAEEEYGNGGFGYDPVFIPDGYDKTFGELPAEIKNSISHRARALQALVKVIG
ncbi:MAG: RdgB/HAM1 family non-canonical purine NTP pyrophosphatase [Paludibacteraceae bacterium]|nr:RdgB/HAM1 family non-canonical purine NTP pyrophosphatase [Paludibacteraceae bacterium]